MMPEVRYLPYTLKINAPAIISVLGGDPNSSRTLAYIPGSVMRGAVAKAVGDPGADTEKRKEFHELVLGGKVRYLNAYPTHEGRRSLPLLLSLKRPKDDLGDGDRVSVRDLAAYMDADSWPEEQLVSVSEKFLTIGAARPILVQPKMSGRIHHQRDRQKGRAWKDSQGRSHGAIFAFESIDAGQEFVGIVQIMDRNEQECENIAKRLKEFLSGPVLIGRSRRAGYGGEATIKWKKPLESEVMGTGTDGLKLVRDDIKPGQRFRLLLTSPCILRSLQTGQVDPAALEEVLGGMFNGSAEIVHKAYAFETVGGFSRKWRLELPQVLAVSAGSVVVLKAKKQITPETILQLENQGIGERKEEGYGRFVFLDPPLQHLTLYRPKIKKSHIRATSGQPPELVERIQKRILHERVSGEIAAVASRIALSARNLPSNSLIGRLRTVLRGNSRLAVDTLRRWLFGDESERLKEPAMKQLGKCKVDVNGTSMRLKEWLEEALDKEGVNISKWLKLKVIAQRHHVVSEESALDLLKKEIPDFPVRLIDAVLAAMAVRNREGAANEE